MQAPLPMFMLMCHANERLRSHAHAFGLSRLATAAVEATHALKVFEAGVRVVPPADPTPRVWPRR